MSIAVSQELKGLKSRLARCEGELATAIEETKRSQRRENQLRQEKASLLEKIKTIEEASSEPVVTEHAILRYLERVHGLDLEAIRREIMSPKTVEMIRVLGRSGKIPLPCGKGRMILKDGAVVTIEA